MDKHKVIILISVLTLLSAFFHFYNLNWGAPFYFHPDERNIAGSVAQLNFPKQMHPHFFAYGSLPIYTIYFTGMAMNAVHKLPTQTVSFENAIVISRAYSALFATLLIPLLFFIGKKLKNERAGLIAAFLAATSTGFMQFAHFGTFEMWLTFFTVILFGICLELIQTKNPLFIFLVGILLGILVAIKISHVILIPIALFVLLIRQSHRAKKHRLFVKILKILSSWIVVLATAFLIYYGTNPFVFFDFTAFQGTMHYESTLALGTLPVFYTGEFYHSIPIVFQFLYIYPFLLNPLLTILFLPAFCYLLYIVIKTKPIPLIVLLSFFLMLFLSQAFLFAKWTRYMVPTLPFVYLIVALAVTDFLNKKRQHLSKVTIATIFIISSIFAFSYFITAFAETDTRIQAYNFAQSRLEPTTPMVTEVYDMGIVPFNQTFTAISLFNFYDLDSHSPDFNTVTLRNKLATTDYLILPSQRLLKTRLLQPDTFPVAHAFYTKLFNGTLGYKKIYQTPCDIFCTITYLGDPVFRFEQTANVFDRPTIMIYKKI